MSSTLSRQVSVSAQSEPVVCKLCEEEISCQPGHLRLSCRCLIHYNCLVKYIIYSGKLLHLESRQNQGVRCPFSYITGEASENTCAMTTATGAHYYLSLEDLYNLVDYGELLKCSSAPDDLRSVHQFQSRCAPFPGLFEYLEREFAIDNVVSFADNLERCEAHIIDAFPTISIDALRGLVPVGLLPAGDGEVKSDSVVPLGRSRSVSGEVADVCIWLFALYSFLL